MARTYKVLGQIDIVAPAAPQDLYTVPGGVMATVSNIQVCNYNGSARTVRIWVRVGGAAAANKHLIVYEVSIPASDFKSFQLGLSLAVTDVVTVQSSGVGVVFNMFGAEEPIAV